MVPLRRDEDQAANPCPGCRRPWTDARSDRLALEPGAIEVAGEAERGTRSCRATRTHRTCSSSTSDAGDGRPRGAEPRPGAVPGRQGCDARPSTSPRSRQRRSSAGGRLPRQAVTPSALVSTIHGIMDGSVSMETSAYRTAQGRRERGGSQRAEVEILRRVASGGPTARSHRSWLSEQTVKYHLTNVYRKIRVSGRTDATRCLRARTRRSVLRLAAGPRRWVAVEPGFDENARSSCATCA
jgi:DNA-binding CsgD family transcriptional regulator